MTRYNGSLQVFSGKGVLCKCNILQGIMQTRIKSHVMAFVTKVGSFDQRLGGSFGTRSAYLREILVLNVDDHICFYPRVLD